MTKSELISKTCEVLRESGKRKIVHVPKQQFTITDDEGHSRMFSVKRQDRTTLYTIDDVRNVMNVMIDLVMDTVKHGDYVYIPGIGTLKIHYREARKVRIPGTRQWKDVPAHYVPKLDCAWALKEAARIYESFVLEKGDPLKAEKPKRGRGRPRKNPIEPIEEDMREEEFEEEELPEMFDDYDDEEDDDDGVVVDFSDGEE